MNLTAFSDCLHWRAVQGRGSSYACWRRRWPGAGGPPCWLRTPVCPQWTDNHLGSQRQKKQLREELSMPLGPAWCLPSPGNKTIQSSHKAYRGDPKRRYYKISKSEWGKILPQLDSKHLPRPRTQNWTTPLGTGQSSRRCWSGRTRWQPVAFQLG